MRKTFLPILALCAVCLFSACDKNDSPASPHPGEAIAITEQLIDGLPESAYITIEDERITITSLAVWDTFNHDGNFSDNCLNFLRNFIESDSEFLEFNSVKISEWEIIRDPEAYAYYSLAFNFTVTESALSTLPVGRYRTIVDDQVDCCMRFEGEDPTEVKAIPDSEASTVVTDWLHSMYRWEMPQYGESDEPSRYVNYLVGKYGDDSGKLLYSDFENLLREKAGISATKDDFPHMLSVENGKLYIQSTTPAGLTCVVLTKEEQRDNYTAITAQFFADYNGFIESMQVEYYIGSENELLGCTVIKKSPYTPYGLRP